MPILLAFVLLATFSFWSWTFKTQFFVGTFVVVGQFHYLGRYLKGYGHSQYLIVMAHQAQSKVKLTRKLIIFLLPIGLLLGFYLWPEQKLPKGLTADKLVVNKSERRLELWADSELIKTYRVSLGKNTEGHKENQGDSRTPEGLYYINDKNPNSQFHLNLGISYPNTQDKMNSPNPGGDIKIHGLKNGIGWIGKFQRIIDWTDGCIAVTNSEIEELYEAVPIGTPIQIIP